MKQIYLFTLFFLFLRIRIVFPQPNEKSDVESHHSPSHIQMCRAILAPNLRDPNNNQHLNIIREKQGMCHHYSPPYHSLLQIMASTFLSEVARIHNINVWYHYRCDPPTLSTENPNHSFQIPQFFPSPMMITNDDNHLDRLTQVSLESLDHICQMCLERFDRDSISSPNCVMFGHDDGHHDHLLRPEAIDDPRTELNQRRKLERNLQDIPMEHQGIHYILPSIKKSLNHASSNILTSQPILNSQQNNILQINEHTWNTIIYLDNDSHRYLESLNSLPSSLFYAIEIPRFTTHIEILTPPNCVETCVEHVEMIRHHLNILYPRATVEHNIHPSSAISFAKMMAAHHLICLYSEDCLLPSFTREKYSVLAIPGFDGHYIHPLLATITLEEHPPKLTIENIQDLHNRMEHSGKCRHLRGRFGQWVQDLSMAPMLQYGSPLNHHVYGQADKAYQPTQANPFRRSTTFRWEATEFPFCGVNNLMTKENLCQALESLGITQFFIVGDSLQQSQAFSLWKLLLGHETEEDPILIHEAPRPNLVKDLQCPNSIIQFSYTRNDQLKENKLPVSIPDEVGNCSMYCYPWTDSYQSHPGKTLLLASVGAHFHDELIFHEAFDEFTRTIDSIRRPEDIVLFRTTVPGHADCHDEVVPDKKKPFDSWFEYEPTITDVYSWDKFINYNEYAERVLYERRYLVKNSKLKHLMAQIELLDVFPMTVLRSDGHVGGEECQGAGYCAKENRDCLHYNLPGPVDWWNHLMQNNLMDIAKETQKI